MGTLSQRRSHSGSGKGMVRKLKVLTQISCSKHVTRHFNIIKSLKDLVQSEDSGEKYLVIAFLANNIFMPPPSPFQRNVCTLLWTCWPVCQVIPLTSCMKANYTQVWQAFSSVVQIFTTECRSYWFWSQLVKNDVAVLLLFSHPKWQILDFSSCEQQLWIWWKRQKVLQMGRKHCGKRRNCLLQAIFQTGLVWEKVGG